MTDALNDLRSQILGCPTKRISFVSDFFCETEISNFNMTLFINEQVLRLEISIGDVHTMEVIKG